MVNISELASADIVLTTYDVLKEDLSHDYDRHEGDRHFLRFQKRFAVNFVIFLPFLFYVFPLSLFDFFFLFKSLVFC